MSEALFLRHRDEHEGVLTTRRAAIVSTRGLARIARRLGLGDALVLGQGAQSSGERGRSSVLAGLFEAIVAAIYLDSGLTAARDFILAAAALEMEDVLPADALKAPKSRLQERVIALTGRAPAYRIVSCEGPDHDRHFVVEASMDGRTLGQGEGRSRREAETMAAEAALATLDADPASRCRRGRRQATRMSLARLRELRMVGFKSFAERTVVEFGPGISAVVGPNGSGKSNLADALRWALGEQGRALRSRRAEDLIFAGSANRRAVGMADVSLVIDNTDRLLSVDFGEVELSRRLFRSGENEYLLNRQRIRLRDLVDLLDDANLADNAFLFIGQGMVDQALALRPEERRPLFEEAAGIRKHQRRRSRGGGRAGGGGVQPGAGARPPRRAATAGPPPGCAGGAAGGPHGGGRRAGWCPRGGRAGASRIGGSRVTAPRGCALGVPAGGRRGHGGPARRGGIGRLADARPGRPR